MRILGIIRVKRCFFARLRESKYPSLNEGDRPYIHPQPENGGTKLVTTCTKLLPVKMRCFVQVCNGSQFWEIQVVGLTGSDKDWWEMLWSCRGGLGLCLTSLASHWPSSRPAAHWPSASC